MRRSPWSHLKTIKHILHLTRIFLVAMASITCVDESGAILWHSSPRHSSTPPPFMSLPRNLRLVATNLAPRGLNYNAPTSIETWLVHRDLYNSFIIKIPIELGGFSSPIKLNQNRLIFSPASSFKLAVHRYVFHYFSASSSGKVHSSQTEGPKPPLEMQWLKSL